MKLILHLGAHKTGTSAVQKFLRNNQKELRSHSWDLVYPSRNVNLGDALQIKRNRKLQKLECHFRPKMYERLLKRLQDSSHNKIITSEDLFFFSSYDDISLFCNDINSIFDEITILVYLRNQVEMALSNKAQGAKSNYSARVFGNDSSNPLPQIDPVVFSYLDYSSKLSIWKQLLPRANFVVKQYSLEKLYNGDSVYDFIQTTDLPVSAEASHANVSIGSVSTNILHDLRSKGLKPKHAASLFKKGYFSSAEGVKQLPSQIEAKNFMDAFEESNRSLSQEFGIEWSLDYQSFPIERIVQGLTIENLYKLFIPIIRAC